MPFFKKTATSSSTFPVRATCSCVVDTQQDNNVNNNNNVNTTTNNNSFTKKRLTRLRKLRHVTDEDLGLDHTQLGNSPQPLPLPELPALTTTTTTTMTKTNPTPPNDQSSSLNSSRRPSSNSSQVLQGVSPLTRNSNDRVGIDAANSSRWRSSQGANTRSANYQLRLKIPPKSAPASGAPSPVSPRGGSSVVGTYSPTCDTTSAFKSSNNYLRNFCHDLNFERNNVDYCLIASPQSDPTSSVSTPVSPRRLTAVSSSSLYSVAVGANRFSSKNRRKLSHDQLNVERVIQDYSLIASSESAPASGAPSPISHRGRGTSSSLSCVAPGGSKPLSICHKKWSRDSNIERTNQDHSLIASSQSAPTSGASSHVLVQKQFNIGDFLPNNVADQEIQVQSPLEVNLRCLTSRNPQISSEKPMCSPEHSPFHSPRLVSPRTTLRSPDRFAFRLTHELIQENYKDRSHGSSPVTAHPLPLPPGAASSTSRMLSPIHPKMEKPSLSLKRTQWQKGKLIGCGTYGRVYLGTNRETGALCAMKEVDIVPDDARSVECIKQLEQEIKVLQHLKHPNIVQYYGSEIVDDHLYIYLEYIYPGSICKYVQEHCGAINESIVRNFTRHILHGLAYLHRAKTIHRDIKGANLLVDASGTVKLADFGMAKHLTGMSCELSLKGSPHWMAPEVIKAAMQKDASPELAMAVDIWSLGCTVIEMFTGKAPWGDLQGPQAMFKVLNRSPPIPETLSKDGKNFLSRCLQRNPTDRPSAITLLEHPFVCHPIDLHLLSSRQDKAQSPRECIAQKTKMTRSCSWRKNDNLLISRKWSFIDREID